VKGWDDSLNLRNRLAIAALWVFGPLCSLR
jgi:hypothetical protein